MAALVPIASRVDDVALTPGEITVVHLSARQPSTFTLPAPDPKVGPAEARFLTAVGASLDAPGKLRSLFVHLREGRDIFVTEDAETFGETWSEQRERLDRLLAPGRIMSIVDFERYCRSRQAIR